MSRAMILLDEMPEDCVSCPANYDAIYCSVYHKSTLLVERGERPDWCEIIEIPDGEVETEEQSEHNVIRAKVVPYQLGLKQLYKQMEEEENE